jgi:hypothetical protein
MWSAGPSAPGAAAGVAPAAAPGLASLEAPDAAGAGFSSAGESKLLQPVYFLEVSVFLLLP